MVSQNQAPAFRAGVWMFCIETLASPKTICSPRKWECKHSHFARLHCIDKPDPVEGNHVSGMSVATHLKRLSQSRRTVFMFTNTARRDQARPCTQVGFLPLHLRCFHQSYSLRSPSPLSLGVSVRIPRITPAGVTRYRAPPFLQNVGVSGLSSSSLRHQRLPNADFHSIILDSKLK